MADERIVVASKLVDPTTTSQQAGVDASGNLSVKVNNALPAGTNNIGDIDVLSVVPGTGATNLGKAIDSAAGGTDTGVAPLAQRDDALSALTPVEGDYVPLRVDANGALWTRDDILDAVIAGSELQVDVVAALPAGTNNIGDVDVLTEPATVADGGALPSVLKVIAGYDGSVAQAIKTDADGNLQVDILSGSGETAPAGATINTATSAALAAGAAADLDSAEITETEYLAGVFITASVPFKAEIKTVIDAVVASRGIVFGRAGETREWRPPHRHYVPVTANAGLDVFRVSVTNLDTSEAADVYCTFFYQNN